MRSWKDERIRNNIVGYPSTLTAPLHWQMWMRRPPTEIDEKTLLSHSNKHVVCRDGSPLHVGMLRKRSAVQPPGASERATLQGEWTTCRYVASADAPSQRNINRSLPSGIIELREPKKFVLACPESYRTPCDTSKGIQTAVQSQRTPEIQWNAISNG